jgi:sugar O-acyltransferase (sialic acid O-acetyltransferase NeuD family)
MASMSKQCGIYVVGTGGHGKVVIATLQESGHDIAGVLDDNPATWGKSFLGFSIRGPSSILLDQPTSRAVLAVGDNRRRRELARQMSGIQWMTVVHPRAFVHASVRLGMGSVVFAGAIIQPDAVIGAHSIINTAATVDHDCRIGDFVHVAPGVHLAGGVTVGSGVLLGIGACVTPGVEIGSDTIIGAGAAVICPIPGKVIAFGIPARIQGTSDERL